MRQHKISNNTVMISLFLSMHVLAIKEVENYHDYECFKAIWCMNLEYVPDVLTLE